MKNTFIALLFVVILGGGLYIYLREDKGAQIITNTVSTTTVSETLPANGSPVTETPVSIDSTKTTLGVSVSGNAITAYHFGTGQKELLFV